MTIQQLISKLKAVRDDSDAVIERGLLKAGEKTRSRAVLLCPVQTGELRNSIKVQKVAPLTVSVGTNKEYAPYVEYGTGTAGDPEVPHTSKESWRWQDEQGNWHTSHGQPPQTFLRPAVREQEAYETEAVEIRKALDD